MLHLAVEYSIQHEGTDMDIFLANIFQDDLLIQDSAEVHLMSECRTFRTLTYYGTISIYDIYLADQSKSLKMGQRYELVENKEQLRRWLIQIDSVEKGFSDNTRFCFTALHDL